MNAVILFIAAYATVIALAWLLFKRSTVAKSLRKHATSQLSQETTAERILVHETAISAAVYLKHAKLGELLKIEGQTLAGEKFLHIFSIEASKHFDLLYARVGLTVQRSPAGAAGIVRVKQGGVARIRTNEGALFFDARDQAGADPKSELASEGFDLIVMLVQSLQHGCLFRVVTRGASSAVSFIKAWDIPAPQSDQAIISEAAEVAASQDVDHVYRIRDVQLASAFGQRYCEGAGKLEPGICYLLGKGVGLRLDFTVTGDVGIFVTSVDLTLEDHLIQLLAGFSCRKPLMHARIGKGKDGITVGLQSPRNEFVWHSLRNQNVALTLPTDQLHAEDVLRIVQDDADTNVVSICYCGEGCQTVMIWLLASAARAEAALAERQRTFEANYPYAPNEASRASFIHWAGGERATLAIVFTDLVGFTQLSVELKDTALNELRRAHFDQNRKLIAEYGGCEIKTIGDSFMAAFRTVESAFHYARHLQRIPGHPQAKIRAGIHVGPMLIEENDAFGVTVNFASRVVSVFKEPDICLSDRAKEDLDHGGDIQDRDLRWERRDNITLKGFDGAFTLWILSRNQIPPISITGR